MEAGATQPSSHSSCPSCGAAVALWPGAPCPACGAVAPSVGEAPGAGGWSAGPQAGAAPGAGGWTAGPQAPPPPPGGYGYAATYGPGTAMTPTQVRDYTMWTHLSALVGLVSIPSPLGPLVMWLVRREADPLIDAHGKEALNFNLSALLYLVVAIVFTVVTFGLGIPVAVAVFVAWLVFVIIATVKASKSEFYRYPLTIRFVS